MNTGSRIAWSAATLIITLLGPGMAAGQPAAAIPNPDAAYLTLEEAIEREAQAVEDRDHAQAFADAEQQAARASADAEIAARREQVASLQRIEGEIATALDRFEAAGKRPERLLLEKTVLEDWYATLEPVLAHLTERSFLATEQELAALAGAGLIEPGPRRFRSYADLKNRIVAISRSLIAQKAVAERTRATLLAQITALGERRQRAMKQLGSPQAGSEAARLDWLAAAGALGRTQQALTQARANLEAATQGVLDATGRQRPPLLGDVVVRADGALGPIYSAAWRRGDGSDAGERDRAAKRQQLAQTRQALIQLIDDLDKDRVARSQLRDLAVERMQRLSGELQRSAARYAADREFQWRTALAVEIGLAVAEVMATGGGATLQRKATEASQAAAAKYAAARVASPLELALIRQHTAQGSGVLADGLRHAGQLGAETMAAERKAMARRMAAAGYSEVAANTRANAVFDRLVANERNRRVAGELVKESDLLRTQSDELLKRFPDLEDFIRGMAEEGAGSIAGNLPEAKQTLNFYFGSRDGSATPVAPHVDTERSTRNGEMIKTGLTVLANGFRAAPSTATTGPLSRAAEFRGRLMRGNAANVYSLGVGLLSSLYQVEVARRLDNMVNLEADNFAKVLGEVSLAYETYQRQRTADRQLEQYIGQLRGVLAGVQGAIKMLDGGLQLRATPTPARVSPDAEVRIELTFSSPLAAAPTVDLGGVAVPMRAAGTGGLSWAGTLRAREVGPGERRLSVSVSSAASRYGSLDSDPSTPAIRLYSREWSGFEQGPDTRHVIVLDTTATPPPATSSLGVVDPFDEGRALVDGVAAPVASSSSPRASPPPAPSDEGCNPRTGSFRRITGTAEVLGGGAESGNTHPASFDIDLDLSDMPSGEVTLCIALGQGSMLSSFEFLDTATPGLKIYPLYDVPPGADVRRRFDFDAPLRFRFTGRGNQSSARGARIGISYIVVVRGANAATTRTWARTKGGATPGTAAATPVTTTTPNVPPGPCRGFSGRWSTNYGPATLLVTGNRVEGRYNFSGDGSFRGTITGNVMNARWQDGSGAGNVRLQLAADGRSFSGRWTRESGSGNPHGEWSGTCQMP